MRQKLQLMPAALAFLMLHLSAPAPAIECATSQCYTDVYNSIENSELPVVSRIKNIHTKLSKTIGTSKAQRSKLFVIDSPGYPWAVALSDNTIVLTKGAIEAIYNEIDAELGDARIAFVIGHELSHLATDDLFHHRAFVNNRSQPNTQSAWLKSHPEEEIRADLRGFTIATIAGYRTDRLIGGNNDFFRGWLSQFSPGNSTTHSDTETRRKYLNNGFQKILDNIPYYQFAISLAHFGQYKDSQYLLEDFLNQVETQDAFNNLGYVHLQRARAHMPHHLAYKYWIPSLLEPASHLKLIRDRSLFESNEISIQALEHLQFAEQTLKAAIATDETNLTNFINLAAVYLYMPDKIHRAYAAIEDARRTPLGNKKAVRDQLEAIYQLIRVQDDLDSGDRWPKARDTLVQLAKSPSPPDNLLYNLGRMLDDRGRDDTANRYWIQLYDRLAALPRPYQSQVCYRLTINCDLKAVKSPWVDAAMPLGKDIRYPEVRSYLRKSWNTAPIPEKILPGLRAQAYVNESGDSLLALDNHLEMAILRNIPHKYRNLAALINEFGQPQAALPVLKGQIISFNSSWSAYVENNSVREIWITHLDPPK